jgi:hypothetical protein
MLHVSSENLSNRPSEEDTGYKCCYDLLEACGLRKTSNVASLIVGGRLIFCSSRRLQGLHVVVGLKESTTGCGFLCFSASLEGSGNDSAISLSLSQWSVSRHFIH